MGLCSMGLQEMTEGTDFNGMCYPSPTRPGKEGTRHGRLHAARTLAGAAADERRADVYVRNSGPRASGARELSLEPECLKGIGKATNCE